MADPFLITGPAVISFSGGRTSGYMLWRILQAYGGTLPDNVVVCFANTGREMPATLDFVARCASEWGVLIYWLEYRWEPGRHYFEVVSHNSASRAGEPFEMLLASRSMLPNPVMRFCTEDLKIRTIRRFLHETFGWGHYGAVVGLRADEKRRVDALRARSLTKKDGQTVFMPLADAGVTVEDVAAFWKMQPFDLELTGPWEGNCDGCFLKGRGAIERMLLDYPERMVWWSRMESEKAGSTWKPEMRLFRADRDDYATMARTVRDQGRLPLTYEETFGPCENGGCGI